ncbi:ABC transporter permease [Limnochorda pilosa]|uniref:Transport permease protein n=1 Tax=Limnochorda pilosa TaxID=1555112 RepID=A0A0K2SGV9_LIMPI|nr:ABC transporter permease [Limnochorda pilosa]BAS26351.1 ABC transporter [Limnochorda pilosa]
MMKETPTPVIPATWGLTRRWAWRLKRQPAALLATLVQPAVWLILFGNMFRSNTVVQGYSYIAFMTAGVVVMTVFNGGLNGGVELLFDKETGMLRRLLAAPIPRMSILLSRVSFVAMVTSLQSLLILFCAYLFGVVPAAGLPGVAVILATGLLFGMGVTALSLALVFRLRDHGQFFSILEFATLPIIFASTALVPLEAMPPWLQFVARLNPMTYAINNVRDLVLEGFNPLGVLQALGFVLVFAVAALVLASVAIRRVME